MVMKRRRANLLQETMRTITNTASGEQQTHYLLGSRTEGTTTPGLQSDIDIFQSLDNFIVIQDWSEWTLGKANYLMIQDETTPPGYCLLQALRSDAPLPCTFISCNHSVKDTSGRILLKNTCLDDVTGQFQRQEPSLASAGQHGICSTDQVAAFPCHSWPQSARAWLDQQEANTWPTVGMKGYMKTTPCLVVGVGSKASDNADFEWRLSTSLAERCLTFNLNMTQIRCYILMKMILKTYMYLDNESFISSYMCKTVLFHCIASKPSHIWKEHNILNCLNFCLQTLGRCILSGNCPHFIVHENNLMAGKFSTEVKDQLLERVSNLTPCDGISLFGIKIDDVGGRLQIKLNMSNEVHHNVPLSDVYTMAISRALSFDMALFTSSHDNLGYYLEESLETKLKTRLQIVLKLTRTYRDGEMIEKTACRLLAPLFCTTIGSLIASNNILVDGTVSPQALDWLEAGQDSDVASSRLKLASIMYCAGDMERAASILHDLEEQYNIQVTEPACTCYNFPTQNMKPGFAQVSSQSEVEAAIYITAFCVRFSRSEINCVPHELQYEMFRSTQENLLHRDEDYKKWMGGAVVDSHPYLYFLQYKTYGNLQRLEEQQQALNKLMWVIEAERNLGHREPAMNLLGQCMEQENRPVDALQCYRLSLQLRERNNAAKIHICKYLANILS